jgi:anti-sigma B factor antagonist
VPLTLRAMTSPVQVVRKLWEAYDLGGVEAMLDAAGEDVVWQPHVTPGRIYRTTADLRAALAALEEQGVRYEARLHGLEEHGGVVLASGTVRVHRDGAVDERDVEWAYHFRDGRLWRQSTHGSREDALDALTALRAIDAAFGVAEQEGPSGERVVRVNGELDIATAGDLERAILRPREPGERVVLDLTGLRFMDSTGLRVLLRARTEAKAGRWELYLRNVPANVQRLFSISGVQDAVPPEPPTDLAG